MESHARPRSEGGHRRLVCSYAKQRLSIVVYFYSIFNNRNSKRGFGTKILHQNLIGSLILQVHWQLRVERKLSALFLEN